MIEMIGDQKSIVARLTDPQKLNALIIACLDSKRDLYLAHSYFSSELVEEIARDVEASAIMYDDSFKVLGKGKGSPEGSLYIMTSGTTGKPKITRHLWDRVQASSEGAQKLAGKIWLMSYSPTSYAGLQVFFSAYNTQGKIIYPPADIALVPQCIVDEGVEVVSATPSYWRMLLAVWPKNLQKPKLQQATLGGERVDQQTLDLIDQEFSPVGLTHIYASSEGGTAVVVSDRKEGFPAEYLKRKGPIQLRIVEGCLQMKTPSQMLGYVGASTADGWIDVGDFVEERGGRVYFLGRKDEMINVGGRKVLPQEVESVLASLPQIQDCRVYGKKNPVVGAVVAAEVVLKPGQDLDATKLRQQLKEKLEEFQIPQLFKQVKEIEVGENGKRKR